MAKITVNKQIQVAESPTFLVLIGEGYIFQANSAGLTGIAISRQLAGELAPLLAALAASPHPAGDEPETIFPAIVESRYGKTGKMPTLQ